MKEVSDWLEPFRRLWEDRFQQLDTLLDQLKKDMPWQLNLSKTSKIQPLPWTASSMQTFRWFGGGCWDLGRWSYTEDSDTTGHNSCNTRNFSISGKLCRFARLHPWNECSTLDGVEKHRLEKHPEKLAKAAEVCMARWSLQEKHARIS